MCTTSSRATLYLLIESPHSERGEGGWKLCLGGSLITSDWFPELDLIGILQELNYLLQLTPYKIANNLRHITMPLERPVQSICCQRIGFDDRALLPGLRL